MRLVVTPAAAPAGEGYDVRVELVNVADRPIVLRAAWEHQEDAADLAAYLIAATNIESDPPVAPWIGQIMQGHRASPQPERTLAAGETLLLAWRTEGRVLKNGVSNPLFVQNPRFPVPGLYAVHATLIVPMADGPVRLRSNEQLVPVGGSTVAPRHTYGQLLEVDAAARTGTLGLGSLHGVKVGDRFGARSNYRDAWTLTVNRVEAEMAFGTIAPDPLPPGLPIAIDRAPVPPDRHAAVTLIEPK
jgi:hypothetical protein